LAISVLGVKVTGLATQEKQENKYKNNAGISGYHNSTVNTRARMTSRVTERVGGEAITKHEKVSIL
jgi:hypothetical protein